MEIYFVRHGQTGGNEAKRHQAETSKLTPLGKKQAQLVAVKLAVQQPTHLLVSNRVRAIETAQAISQAADLTPEVNEVFTELCRPLNLYGYHHKSPQSIWYIYQWYQGKVGDMGCTAAGESYAHFFRRVKKAQQLLESLPADARVVVVSHSIFINFFVAHLHSDKPMSLVRAVLIFTKILRIRNGSVTRLEYQPEAGNTSGWKLHSYGA